MLRPASGRWWALMVPLAALVLPLGATEGPSGRLVYLKTDDGVSVVDTSTGRETISAEHALPTGDWSRVVDAHRTERKTVVTAIDPLGIEPVVKQMLDGNLRVRTVSYTGDLVALMPRDPEQYGTDGIYAPASREHTQIVVTRFDGTDPRTYELDANVEPEAFAVDGTALFVIQYLPPLEPDRYRVRRLDLTSGELTDVFTNDKLIQGNMRGTAYDQVAAPDGSRVYTLYRKHTGETFVHLLDLVNQTAQCVLLPSSFGTKPGAMAITARFDGAIFIVDPAVHEIAELAPAHHGVAISRPYSDPIGDGSVVAAVTPGAVFIASGDEVVELTEPTLTPGQRWEFGADVEAIHVGTDGVLYVALPDRLVAVRIEGAAAATDPLLDIEVEGIAGISDSLPVTGKGYVECAC